MAGQVIICPCGKQFAGCWEPHCFSDPHWHRDIRKYQRKGCKVSSTQDMKLEECTCPDFKPVNPIPVEPVDPNQLALF